MKAGAILNFSTWYARSVLKAEKRVVLNCLSQRGYLRFKTEL